MSLKIGKIASEIVRFVLRGQSFWVVYCGFVELKIFGVVWMDYESAL
jgi:hypothetical protein